MDTEEFQLHVVKALARLDANMKTLIGNGQPGRIEKIEIDVKSLNRWRWIIGGVVVTLSALIHWYFRY
jgi:hypothetical protein